MQRLYCWRCDQETPMLDEDEFAAVVALRRGVDLQPMLEEYERLTGFKETNASAIWHHRLALYGPRCRQCTKPL